MKRRTRLMVVMGAVCAALVGGAQVASAETVSWYSYPGFQSTWHCNTTSSYNLGGGQGWAYVQACEAVNGQYFQGLVNVSFSQAHSDVVISVADSLGTDPWDYSDYDGRTCNGPIGGGLRSCFAYTESPISHWYTVAAHVTGLVVDGVGVDLNAPASGPAQEYSPIE